MAIILASKSPRRSELLARMGVEFTVKTSKIDEKMDPFANPADEVARVSLAKAQAVRGTCHPDDIIIGADTIVVCDGLTMGKPRSESEAFSMLRRLSGRDHQVLTGLTVLGGDRTENLTVATTLRFRALSDAEIRLTKPAPMGFRDSRPCLSWGWTGTITMSWGFPSAP